MKTPNLQTITDQLRPPALPGTPRLGALADPVADTPMRVSLEQLRPYEHNPRLMRNPLYEDLKASIRQRGLDQPPPITRRPGEPYFIIRNGGNTRLAILNELWQETHEERFARIHCLFRPWTSEADALLGHLAESDLHGPLSFIERALAIAQLKAMFEQDGTTLSQRALAVRLREQGYPISQPHISKMLDSLEHLLPAIPQVLYGGLGKPQIERLISLRKNAEHAWCDHGGQPLSFHELWLTTLAGFDAHPQAFDAVKVQDELLVHMGSALGQPTRVLALEMITGPEEHPAVPLEPMGTPLASPTSSHSPLDRVTPEPPPQQPSTAGPLSHAVRPEQGTSSLSPGTEHSVPLDVPSRVENIREHIARTLNDNAPSVLDAAVDGVWRIEAPGDDPAQLREQIAQAAHALAAYAGCPEIILPCDRGLGFEVQVTLTQDSPRSIGVQLLLSALLGRHDQVDWQDRRHLPAALFGHVLVGLYQLNPGARSAASEGLEALPDGALLTVFHLIRLARRLIQRART